MTEEWHKVVLQPSIVIQPFRERETEDGPSVIINSNHVVSCGLTGKVRNKCVRGGCIASFSSVSSEQVKMRT